MFPRCDATAPGTKVIMTNVHHVESAPLSRLFPTRRDRPSQAPESEARTGAEPARTDQVDLSESARALNDLTNRSDIRADLVARVRAEIASGGYVTDDKIDAAVDALSAELEG